jgi:transketolase
VAEEHNVYGGVATACADALVDGGIGGIKMERVGLPADEYALIAPPTTLYRHYGLDAEGLAAAARRLLAR